MNKEVIYIVEDDAHISQLVKYNLELEGYSVREFEDGKVAKDAIDAAPPTLVILDIMLPGMSGVDILKHIRSTPALRHLPALMLTAKSDEFDKVLGLELGADDYIAKPFAIRELTARVKAVLRRSHQELPVAQEDIVICGNVKILTEAHKVYVNELEVELTLKEFELLKYLMLNKGKVMRRDLLLDKLWGYYNGIETRTVDVHIRRLRTLIGEDYIETVRGIGYRYKN